MRWILWGDGEPDARPCHRRARADHPLHPRGQGVRRVGLLATASYLPERWMTAAEIAARSGIPEQVIVEKFGLRGKHIAAADEHVSDLSVKAIERLLDETGFDPKNIDVVMYYGSMWRDHAVWQAAPHIAYRVGATNAFAIEYDNVSHGTPIALRVARDLLRAESELAERPRRRRVPRVVPPRLREREVALHVQLRRRRRGRAPRRWRRAQRGARVARDHERCLLAAGEGRRRRLGRSRRLPVPRRPGPGRDEGRARPGVPAELRRRRARRGGALRASRWPTSTSSARCTRSARCSQRCCPSSG